MFFSKIIFQNTYLELANPPPLSWKKHLKFPFWLSGPFPKLYQGEAQQPEQPPLHHHPGPRERVARWTLAELSEPLGRHWIEHVSEMEAIPLSSSSIFCDGSFSLLCWKMFKSSMAPGVLQSFFLIFTILQVCKNRVSKCFKIQIHKSLLWVHFFSLTAPAEAIMDGRYVDLLSTSGSMKKAVVVVGHTITSTHLEVG